MELLLALAAGAALAVAVIHVHRGLVRRVSLQDGASYRPTPAFLVAGTCIALALALFAAYGMGIRFSGLLLLWGLLAAAAFTDLDTLILPDLLTLPLALCAPPAANVLLGLTLPLSLAGGAVAAGLLLALALLTRRIAGREFIGLGDVKLAFALGSLTGPWRLPEALLASSALALAALPLLPRRGKSFLSRELPFGPFLCLGVLASLLTRRLWF